MAEARTQHSPADLAKEFPDIDVPHLEAMVSFLYAVGGNVEDISSVDATPYVRVQIDGQEWLILNDSEAHEYAQEQIEELFEESGTEGFAISDWKEFVENSLDFAVILRDTISNYIENISSEPGEEPDETRLQEEMRKADVADEEEFAEWLAEQWVPNDDVIDWYVEEFGEEAFKEMANIDTEALAKYVIDTDGLSSIIASYDGDEMELGKGYAAYRVE